MKKCIVLTIILFVMILTNPNINDYKQYLRQNISRVIKPDTINIANNGNDAANSILAILGNEIINTIEISTIRKNYLVFCTFESSPFGKRIGFVGILGNFVPIH